MKRLLGRIDYWLHKLREARHLMALVVLLLASVAAFIWFSATQPERLRPFGTEKLGQDVVCSRYGDGEVCRPAPQAVRDARAIRRERLEAAAR